MGGEPHSLGEASPLGATGAGMLCARNPCSTTSRPLHFSLKPPLLALSLLLLAGCGHEDGRGTLTNANMAPEVRDRNLPLDQRIANIQKDPNIPAPEKERMVRLLTAQTPAR